MKQELLDKLPIDIIHHIIPYTYQIQDKHIQDDIIDYHKSKSMIYQIYYDYWVNFIGDLGVYRIWLIHDLFLYANHNQTFIVKGYTESFYTFFKRNRQLHTNEEIDTYIQKLEYKDENSQINIFWGLLTPKERNEFIYKKVFLL
jgi:hypothetical protein